jgi:phosphotriesterase-related protein
MQGRYKTSLTRRAALAALLGNAANGLGSAPARTVESVTGRIPSASLGVTLMHEHIVTDLRAPTERQPGDYDARKAFAVARPFLDKLRKAGCKTLVEPTPMHIGRDPATLQRLSEATGVNIVCATGIYAAANQRFIPDYARRESARRLADRYVIEIEDGIGTTNIRPGLIKTGVNQESPLPAIERKLVSAALLASKDSGLSVASHTAGGAQALEQLSIADELHVEPSHMIWVHAQNEKDQRIHRRAGQEGMWVEFDGLREQNLEWHLSCVLAMAEVGLLNRTLISHDAGWYRPGREGGTNYRGYTFIFDRFLPRLRAEGFSTAEINQLMVANPAAALTRGG